MFLKKLNIYLLFLCFTGCGAISPFAVVSPIITGVLHWINGEAHQYYEYDTKIIQRSITSVVYDLELDQHNIKEKDGAYHIHAGKNNRFCINIKPIEPDISRLSMRINFFGDKDYAEMVYKKVTEEINTIRYDENGKVIALGDGLKTPDQ